MSTWTVFGPCAPFTSAPMSAVALGPVAMIPLQSSSRNESPSSVSDCWRRGDRLDLRFDLVRARNGPRDAEILEAVDELIGC